MASQAGVTLDSVVINIESNAVESTDSIDKLATSLSALKTAVKGGFNPIKKLAENILQLKHATKGLGTAVNRLSNLEKIATLTKSLSEIPDTKNLKALGDNLGNLVENVSKLDSSVIENFGRVTSELAEKVKPLAKELQSVADGYTAISKLAKNYNVSIKSVTDSNKAAKTAAERLKTVLKALGSAFKFIVKQSVSLIGVTNNFFKKAQKPFKTITSKIKQMGFALLSVRSAFTFTRKAIDEYMQMDTQLQSSIQNTWRAMGAQLAPIVEYVSNLFHQFVRVIYSVVLALTGIDLISRANEKAMKGWGKSTKDTLGNLQKFDDLNVVDFSKSGSGDDNKLIDMDTIDLSPFQKIMDWVKKLKNAIKDALNTGQWKEVGRVFGEGINGALTFLIDKIGTIQDTLERVILNITDFLKGAVGEIEFEDLGKNISNFFITYQNIFSTLFKNIPWSELGKGFTDTLSGMDIKGMFDAWVDVYVSLFSGLVDAIIAMDSKTLGKKLYEVIDGVFSGISAIATKINWTGLGQSIRKALEEIPWKKVWQKAFNALKDIFKSADGFVDAVVGSSVGGEMMGVITALLGIAYIAAPLVSTVGKISSTISSLTGGKKDTETGKIGSKEASGIKDAIANIGIIVGSIVGLVAVLGLLTQIDGFEEIMTDGSRILASTFTALTPAILPIAAFATGAALLSKIKVTDFASGAANLAIVIGGTELLTGLLGALFTDDGVTTILEGADLIRQTFEKLESVIVPIAAFSALTVALGFVGPDKALAGIAGFAAIVAGLEVVLYALGGWSMIDGFSWVVGEGGKMLQQLGEILGGFAGGIVAGFLNIVMESFENIGTSLSNFMTNAQPFFDGLSGVDTNIGTMIKNIAEAILILTTTDMMDGINWFGKTSLDTFGASLPAFGTAMVNFANNTATLSWEVVDNATKCANAVSEMANNLPKTGGFVSLFEGENSLLWFAAQLPTFGASLVLYAQLVEGLPKDVVENSVAAAQVLASFEETLPDHGGLKQWITGDATLESFGKSLYNFGLYFALYAAAVKDISLDNIKNVTSAVSEIVSMLEIVSDNDLHKTAKSFGKSLKDEFAPKISDFFKNHFGTTKAASVGAAFGKQLAKSINSGLKNNLSTKLKITNNRGAAIDTYTIKGYYTGGFPESGQYFYARENGIPEYVGSIGNRTAVANNVQIIEGIRQGVAEGMRESGSGETTIPLIINLGNEQLYKGQQKFNKQQQNKYGIINL